MNDRPDYWGYWVYGSEFSQFFITLFVKRGTNIEGFKLDKNGKADITGVVSPETIRFSKKYNSKLKERLGGVERVEYFGKSISYGIYEGTYAIISSPESKFRNSHGTFFLQEFPKSGVLDLVYENFRNRYEEE